MDFKSPHQKQETPTGAWLIGVFIWVWRNILRVTLSRQVALIWEPRKIIVLIFRGWTRLQVQPQELGALRDLLGRKTQRRKPQSRSVPFALNAILPSLCWMVSIIYKKSCSATAHGPLDYHKNERPYRVKYTAFRFRPHRQDRTFGGRPRRLPSGR